MVFKRLSILFIFGIALVILIFAYKYFNPIDHALFPKCPIKHFTGLDCPGCGGQRAIHLLLNGELRNAFLQNPLIFFLAPYVVLGFYLQLVPHPTLGELKIRKFLYGHRAIQILFSIIVLFTIFRNIL